MRTSSLSTSYLVKGEGGALQITQSENDVSEQRRAKRHGNPEQRLSDGELNLFFRLSVFIESSLWCSLSLDLYVHGFEPVTGSPRSKSERSETKMKRRKTIPGRRL
ncbi:hypothetical protein ACH5RR_029934 [Cinchona calisaya]|uniref:Uncharacterized protein n=1 Tax=Cinchona calisaya TaxID=153742 RepID=A0ABD2YUD9_9GENT